MRTRRGRIAVASAGMLLWAGLLVFGVVRDDDRSMLVGGSFLVLQLVLVVVTVRQPPLPPELTLERLRAVRFQAAVVTTAAVVVVVGVVVVALSGPRPAGGLVLAAALLLPTAGFVVLLVRIAVVVRRGEIPETMRRRYAEAVRRRA